MSHICVDLDGTLALYDGWEGPEHIGEPVPLMLQRVKEWLADGIEVRIFTARASVPEHIPPVKAWCKKHLGVELEVTNQKHYNTVEFWDDRGITVEHNTGRVIKGKSRAGTGRLRRLNPSKM